MIVYKSRVSITTHGKITPLYAIVYAIMYSTENFRFDKEDNFYVLVFYTGYFIKEIENISPLFPYVVETLVKVWENSSSHFNFSFSQTSTRVSVYNFMDLLCFK